VTLPDRGTREAAILNVVAANGRYAAGGIPIAPGARPDDGEFDVVIVDDVPLTTLLGFLPELVAGEDGRHPDHPAWHHCRSRRIEVAALADGAGAALPVSVDGENMEARSVAVELVPGRLRVLAPPSQGSSAAS
jgi:diacylglycerol kinase (ATP)